MDLITKLLAKTCSERLGGGLQDGEAIKSHPFFNGVDWDKLLNKEYNAPFVPKLKKGHDDVSYFPSEFTAEQITSEDFVFDSQGNDRTES